MRVMTLLVLHPSCFPVGNFRYVHVGWMHRAFEEVLVTSLRLKFCLLF